MEIETLKYRLNQLEQYIEQSERILLTTHVNPDGDAVGSMLAVYHYLEAKGVKCKMLVPGKIPSFLVWMEGCNKIIVGEQRHRKAVTVIENASLIICIDFNALQRTAGYSELIRQSTAKKILIDHHPQPEPEFDLVFSDTEFSSTAELVYRMIEISGDTALVDSKIAVPLYVGIMTDTGSFSFSCNRPDTFRVAASLIEAGVDAEKVHRRVFDTYSENRMRLLGFCLSEKLIVLNDYATAYISLSAHELEHFGYVEGDNEGLVNFPLSIRNVVLSVLFIEREDKIRLSFRSKGNFSVNEFARKHFNGGGHRNAAGADSVLSLDEAISYFISVLYHYKLDLKEQLTLDWKDNGVR